MSSSPTEQPQLVDVTMPQMGVSVAEGTIVAWRVGVGDRIEADADDLRDLHRQDRHRGPGARGRRGRRDPGRGGRDRRRWGPCWRAWDELGCRAAAARGRSPARSRAPRRSGRRRYSPVVSRIAAEHGIDLCTGHRDRAATAGCASRTCSRLSTGTEPRRRGGRRAAAAHREPVPAGAGGTGAARARRLGAVAGTGAGGAAGGAAVAHAAPDRRAHEALARDRRHVHHLDRGRHGPRGGRRGRSWGSPRWRSWPAPRIDALREHPALNAWLEGERYTRAQRRQPRDRGVARRGRADRAGHPPRPRALRGGPGGADQGPGPAGAGPRADRRRGPGRDVHDHQPGPVRLDHGHADHQPAAGRRSSTSRRWSSGPVVVSDADGQRLDRHPADDDPRA